MTINMILLFILMSYMTFHHPINTFITIYGSKFQLLNRLDSTHISARPSDGAKDDKAIVIFTISDLEKYILREEYSSNKPKSENFVVSLLFGIMCSLSSSIIIIAFAPNFNVYVNGIISFLVGALAGGFMYCKKLKENKKIERKPEEKESLKKKSKVNDYSKISVMIIMLSIIVIGVIYSVYSDWSVLIENPLTGSGKICKDLIPLASIVFGYYLGKDSKD
ncbi:hypothetical protein L2528_05985 [Limosilactobacillus vaginalis]|nr:hypothetical protein [Limosilactobacillus vaginalis]MCZ3746983.1 hypothetical protein [Limosilactobacillus vaginalis]MCZ3751926.1 hypothetical protein [Limosilactobacillus vaginalis]MCZ3757046.1 hypothetical protein [Limosilactobacillus vaginalis]MCZ3758750.1 hypothetical protein [Limosilactobacillus vaginalis]MCZ3764012.1 hypothetical protein [Limosilactobacillus vaginalis]